MSGVNAREGEVMLEVKSFLRGGRCGWKERDLRCQAQDI